MQYILRHPFVNTLVSWFFYSIVPPHLFYSIARQTALISILAVPIKYMNGRGSLTHGAVSLHALYVRTSSLACL